MVIIFSKYISTFVRSLKCLKVKSRVLRTKLSFRIAFYDTLKHCMVM